MEADGSDPLIIQADKRLLPRYSAISSAMPAITPPAGEEIRIQILKLLMTLWDFPLKIQESIFLRRRFRDCLNHLQGGAVT